MEKSGQQVIHLKFSCFFRRININSMKRSLISSLKVQGVSGKNSENYSNVPIKGLNSDSNPRSVSEGLTNKRGLNRLLRETDVTAIRRVWVYDSDKCMCPKFVIDRLRGSIKSLGRSRCRFLSRTICHFVITSSFPCTSRVK